MIDYRTISIVWNPLLPNYPIAGSDWLISELLVIRSRFLRFDPHSAPESHSEMLILRQVSRGKITDSKRKDVIKRFDSHSIPVLQFEFDPQHNASKRAAPSSPNRLKDRGRNTKVWHVN